MALISSNFFYWQNDIAHLSVFAGVWSRVPIQPPQNRDLPATANIQNVYSMFLFSRFKLNCYNWLGQIWKEFVI